MSSGSYWGLYWETYKGQLSELFANRNSFSNWCLAHERQGQRFRRLGDLTRARRAQLRAEAPKGKKKTQILGLLSSTNGGTLPIISAR